MTGRLAWPALILAALAMPACGLKTPPRPLEATAPVMEEAPRVTVSDDGMVSVRWRRPERSHDGVRLYDLAGFSVERDTGTGFNEVARVTVDDNERIRPQRSFEAADPSAPPGPSSYRVRALLADGQWGSPGPASSITVPRR